MFVAKWSWRNQYKVFLIDTDFRCIADKKAREAAGLGGTLEIEEVIFGSVPHRVSPGDNVLGVKVIMTSED